MDEMDVFNYNKAGYFEQLRTTSENENAFLFAFSFEYGATFSNAKFIKKMNEVYYFFAENKS